LVKFQYLAALERHVRVAGSARGREEAPLLVSRTLPKARPAAPQVFQIGELAGLLDLSPRTIRYYEEIGLLTSVRRMEGGKRIYTSDDLRRLRFIKKLKALGLTLAEMQELEAAYRKHRTNRTVLPRLIELLDRRVAEIDERIETLASLRYEIVEYRSRILEKLKRDDEGAGA
jgi:DNA-binding transcriptional MerR regulator